MSCQSVTVYVIRGEKPDSDTKIIECAGMFRAGQPVPELRVFRLPGKRPYFVSARDGTRLNGLYFSVSHSGEYWCCAFSEKNVGLDIQLETSADCTGIAKRFFHPADAAEVVKNGRKELFFDIWAAKESVVKYYGKGIDGDFSSYRITKNGSVADKCGSVFLTAVQTEKGYHTFVSSENPPDIRVVFEQK